ncbi:uncharacterized protein LAJ45_08853 [Morchella importuna]|uniref:uncharacterized protein n=1 Tax=Morchella importuna TaxID=1174673 RepID=UPI001E8E770C|nr:uncharacterized protein LAJ45_08853 [Morchella importuna]KAH8147054.1 hypothetical protein LAJ45_08853 [Morchella importuna]
MSEYGKLFNSNPYPYPQPPVESSSYYGSNPPSLQGSLGSQGSFSNFNSFRTSVGSQAYVSRFQEHMNLSQARSPVPPDLFPDNSDTAGLTGTITSQQGTDETPKLQEIGETREAITKVPTITPANNTETKISGSIDATFNAVAAPPPENTINTSILRVQRSEVNLRPPNLAGDIRKQISTPSFRDSLTSAPSENSRSSIFGSLRRSKVTVPPVIVDLPYVIPPLTYIQPPAAPPALLAPPGPTDLPYVLPPLTYIQVPGEPIPSPIKPALPMVTVTQPSPKARPADKLELEHTENTEDNVSVSTPANLVSQLRVEQSIRTSTSRECVSMDVHRSTALQMDIAEQRFTARAAMTDKERRDAEKRSLRVKAELDKFNKEEEKQAAIRTKKQEAEERKRLKAEDKEAETAIRARDKERRKVRKQLERRHGNMERFAQSEFQMKLERFARKMKSWVGLGPDPGWD